MVLIWRGDGAWVPVVVIVVFFVLEVVAAMISVEGSKAHTMLLMAAIMLVSAGIVFLIARLLRGRPGPRIKDRKTGTITQYARKDEFFFIPLGYWPGVLAALAVLCVGIGATRGSL